MYAPINPRGTEMMAGFVNVISGSPVKILCTFYRENTLGLMITRISDDNNPESIPVIAPAVLNFFQ